jgi:hypothetical protein
MRRRDLIALFGGSEIARPLAYRAQRIVPVIGSLQAIIKYTSLTRSASKSVLAFACLTCLNLAAISRAAGAEESALEDEHIFGFTEGADIGRKGELELESTFTSRFGKPGHYQALENETALRFGIADDVRISLGVLADLHEIRGVPDLLATSAVSYDGLSSETRWQLLDSSKTRFGLTLSLNPQWRRIDDLSGEPATTYQLPAALLVDTQLIPNKLLAAVNVTYTPSVARMSGLWERASTLEASAAISGAVGTGMFLGSEIRYLSTYQGIFLNHDDAQAWFIGPSLYARLSNGFAIKVAWSAQVSGNGANSGLNLVKFEHNQVRALLSKNF